MALEMFKQFWGSGDDYFGRRPTVPQYPGLKAATEDSLSINEAVLQRLLTFAGNADEGNQENWKAAIRRIIPNFDKIIANVEDQALGKIPKDVQNVISGNAAARALGGGYAGSGVHRNLVARDLGLTSLDLMERGMGAAQRWLSMSPAPTDVRAMFVTPAQSFAAMEGKFQRDLLEQKILASPDPAKRGRADQEMALFGMIMGAAGGGGGAQPQYKPEEPPDMGGGGAPAGTKFSSNGTAYAPGAYVPSYIPQW